MPGALSSIIQSDISFELDRCSRCALSVGSANEICDGSDKASSLAMAGEKGVLLRFEASDMREVVESAFPLTTTGGVSAGTSTTGTADCWSFVGYL